MKKGFMIVCDGSNGAGKSTLIKHISDYLKSRGLDIVSTREPGGTAVSEKIRALVLSHDNPEMHGVTELLLFAAARAQHFRELIKPAIDQGKVVISDRFDSATISFQHYARGLPLEMIKQLNTVALEGFRPDLTIILDLDPEEGMKRAGIRPNVQDRLELEDLAFLQRAREGYLIQAAEQPDRFVVIDAAKSMDEVLEEAVDKVDRIVSRFRHNTIAPEHQRHGIDDHEYL